MSCHARLVLIAMGAFAVLWPPAVRALYLLSVDEAEETNLKCPINVTTFYYDNLIPRKIKMIMCVLTEKDLKPGDGCRELTDTVWVWNVQDGRHEALTVSVGCVEAEEQFVMATSLPGDD